MTIIILIIVTIIILWSTVVIYNRIRPLEIDISRSYSNVKVILEKRSAILDKLNDIVNQYTKYERNIVEKMSKDMTPTTDTSLYLNRLENAYPDLKLNTTFLDLGDKLYLIESEKQDKLETYNNVLGYYNSEVTQFPTIIFCNVLGFTRKDFY